MDLSTLADGANLIQSVITIGKFLLAALPWVGTAMLVVIVGNWGGVGDRLLTQLREFLKTTKSVAQDQSAEIKALSAKVDAIAKALEAKVSA